MTHKPVNSVSYLPGQGDFPGTEQSQAQALAAAAQSLKPRKPQKPCDIGLFSDDADQLDLASLFR